MWKYMKCYLKTENDCLKTQTKQPQSHRNWETHLQKKKKKNWNAGHGDTDANPDTY